MGQERLQGTVSTPFTTVMICQLHMNEWRPKPPKLSLSWAWCQETSCVSLSETETKKLGGVAHTICLYVLEGYSHLRVNNTTFSNQEATSWLHPACQQ